MDFKPKFLATGIGSVPHTDTEEAVDFIMKYFPEAPYWPQLPMRGSTEGFLNQFIAPLLELGLVIANGNKYYFDTEQQEWGAKLAGFYEIYMAAVDGDSKALDFFSFPEESAAGFYAFIRTLESRGTGGAKYLKGQITGPLTIGLTLTDQDRKAIYYNLQGRDILIKTLALQGLTQARTLARFGLPVIVFVDDPGLYASGQSSFITLKKAEIIPELNSIFEVIQGAGAVVGTHSCAGMDWSILFESKVDVVSFDAFNYFKTVTGYIEELRAFLGRGGALAWGIVPTAAEHVAGQDVASLARLFEEHTGYLVGKGIDMQVLRDQALITPGCGTGTLSMDLAVRVHELTVNLAAKLIRQNFHKK